MTDEKLTEYGPTFQIKVLAGLFTDRIFLQQIGDIIKTEYFDSDANSWILDTILDHFKEYKEPPAPDVFKVKITSEDDDILKMDILEKLKEVFRFAKGSQSELKFVKDEILKFCKNQEIKHAIMDSVGLLKMGQYDEIKSKIDSAMKAGADTDIGLIYKETVMERYLESARDTVETGWDVVDDIMDGGLGKGELGVVMAPAGIGKSWMLVNIGANALKQGKNVLHYTLELNKEYVGQRYDSVLTGIKAQDLKNHQDAIKDKMSKIPGNLVVKYYPTKSAGILSLKAHIEKTMIQGMKPDLIIVDYADLLRINGKKDRHEALEELYEELRGMGGEYEIPIWTATQANRSSLENDIIEADKTAGSYGKVMVADFLMSLSRKITDKVYFTGRVHIIKNRFGPDGMTLPCKIDTNNGQFNLYEPDTAKGQSTTTDMKKGHVDFRKSLKDKIANLG